MIVLDPATWKWESCGIPICGKDCRRGNGNGDDSDLPECQIVPEANPRREAVVSLLSRGGVGPGDSLDSLDKRVIFPTCRKDGLLLLPDVPAKASAFQILNMAFSGNHPPLWPHAHNFGEIWFTQTTLNDYYVFPLIFTSEVKEAQITNWKYLGLTDKNLENAENYVYYAEDLEVPRVIKREEMISIRPLQLNQMLLIYLAPLMRLSTSSENPGEAVEVALLGEVGKFVPISRERIKGLYFPPGAVRLKLEVCPFICFSSKL